MGEEVAADVFVPGEAERIGRRVAHAAEEVVYFPGVGTVEGADVEIGGFFGEFHIGFVEPLVYVHRILGAG